jgi:hypothetical protein
MARGRFTVRNTSQYPTEEIRSLVRFATSELDMRGVCVNVRNNKRGALAGRAYYSVPSFSNAPPNAEHLVTLRIGAPERFPHEGHMHRYNSGSGRWPEYVCEDWREGLIAIAAHEGKHIDQFRSGTKHSELACETFAAYMLRRYRESNGN